MQCRKWHVMENSPSSAFHILQCASAVFRSVSLSSNCCTGASADMFAKTRVYGGGIGEKQTNQRSRPMGY